MVIYAGFKPVFADVSAESFALNPDSFRAKITGNTKAVLPVHIFGYAAPMTEICGLAGERGIFESSSEYELFVSANPEPVD
jgi:perosamine synthetase